MADSEVYLVAAAKDEDSEVELHLDLNFLAQGSTVDLYAALLGSMADSEVYLVAGKKVVDSEVEHHLDLECLFERLAQGSTSRVNRSNLPATLDHAASAPAPASGLSVTISGSAA
jgi:hypothetical protein